MLTFAIPTWNRATKLRVCLDSICEQVKDRNDCFIVVADNKSSDDTASVLGEYSANYDFLTYETLQEHREGASWIASAKMVQTEWTWTFGDDDILLPGALDKVLAVIQKYPKLSFLHATQRIRSRRSSRLYRADNFLELCETFGWIDICGFISSNICRTVEINESYKNYFHYNDNCLSVFPAAGCFLQTIWDRPAAILDGDLVDLQDAEQTEETQTRWAADNAETRYFYTPDMLRDVIDRVPELPRNFRPSFFRYHTYHLWDRYLMSLIESFLKTNSDVNPQFWEKVLGLSNMVSDGVARKQIMAAMTAAKNLVDTALTGSQQLDVSNKLLENSCYGFENINIRTKNNCIIEIEVK